MLWTYSVLQHNRGGAKQKMKTEKEYNKIFRTMMWWAKKQSQEMIKVRRLEKRIEKLK